jgi:hypothetical protein
MIAYDNNNMETEDDEEEILLVGKFHIRAARHKKKRTILEASLLKQNANLE